MAHPINRKAPGSQCETPGGIIDYNSTFSTSATKRPLSSARNEATTLKTASLKPPTFRMSLRSGAWVVSAKNLVRYNTRDEAIQAGKKPCAEYRP